jgi:hypothetical protein
MSEPMHGSERQVRVVHLVGNFTWGPTIKPLVLRADQRVLSAVYWRGSGNHEQLDLVIEEDVDAE